jgi:YHS domain-containing protein
MLKIKKIVLFIVVLSLIPGLAWGAEKTGDLPEAVIDVRYETCPVMGGKVNPDVSLFHEGKIYHFCCPGCLKSFTENPEKYIAKIKDPVEVEIKVLNVDGNCPVMGGKAKTDSFKIQNDTITFFCCPSCGAKSPASPAKENNPGHSSDHSGSEHH